MKCKKCNFENTETAKFCIKCGTALSQEEINKNPKSKKTLFIIGGIILAVTILIFLINYSNFNSFPENEKTIEQIIKEDKIKEEKIKADIKCPYCGTMSKAGTSKCTACGVKFK